MKFQNNELTKLCITSVWGGEGRGITYFFLWKGGLWFGELF
jgi:hypothetical protein